MNMMTIARAEAAARARRTGVSERPGGKPGDLNAGGAPKIDTPELRERVIKCLTLGPAPRTNICEECGNHRRVRDILDDMAAQGEVETWQVGKAIWYKMAGVAV